MKWPWGWNVQVNELAGAFDLINQTINPANRVSRVCARNLKNVHRLVSFFVAGKEDRSISVGCVMAWWQTGRRCVATSVAGSFTSPAGRPTSVRRSRSLDGNSTNSAGGAVGPLPGLLLGMPGTWMQKLRLQKTQRQYVVLTQKPTENRRT